MLVVLPQGGSAPGSGREAQSDAAAWRQLATMYAVRCCLLLQGRRQSRQAGLVHACKAVAGLQPSQAVHPAESELAAAGGGQVAAAGGPAESAPATPTRSATSARQGITVPRSRAL